MKVLPVPNELVTQVWPVVGPMLQVVVEMAYGEVTLQGIHDRLIRGVEQLIVAVDGEEIVACCVVGVTEWETGKRALQMPYAAGRGLHEWIGPAMDVMRVIAKSLDCTHIRGCGRPGWERVIPGFKKIRVVYEMEV